MRLPVPRWTWCPGAARSEPPVCAGTGQVAPCWRAQAAGAHLVIAADRDVSDTGQQAAAALAAAADRHGIPAIVLLPPERYGSQSDWCDVLAAEAAAGAGVAGATAAAIEAATAVQEEAAGPDEGATLLHLPAVRPATTPADDPAYTPAPAIDDARAVLAADIRAWLRGKGPRVAGRLTPTGTGKSHALAAEAGALTADRATSPADASLPPTAIIVGTTRQRDALAAVGGGVAVPARTPDPHSDGHCGRYVDWVRALVEQARSIAAHACLTCPLGQATMRYIRGQGDGRLPYAPPEAHAAAGRCAYIYNVERAAREDAVVLTAAKLRGDPRVYRIPGTDMEIACDGYQSDAVDTWHRVWTTAEAVQGWGRLRATARPDTDLHVLVVAAVSGTRSATISHPATMAGGFPLPPRAAARRARGGFPHPNTVTGGGPQWIR